MDAATADRRRNLFVDDVEPYHPSTEAVRRNAACGTDVPAPIARPVAPHHVPRSVEQVFGPQPAFESPDPWERQLYEEWVVRLGSERMRGFLAKLLDQFRTLLLVLDETGLASSDDMHRQAHDAASTGGMLGFLEVTRSCRAVLEASDTAGEVQTRPALVAALEDAVLRLDRHLLATQSKAAA